MRRAACIVRNQLRSEGRSSFVRRWIAAGLIAPACLVLAACGGGGGGESGSGSSAQPSKLFVADEGNAAIGSMINPNPAPGTAVVNRVIVGSNNGLGPTTGILACVPGCLPSMALDAANDRLYVARSGTFDHLVRYDAAGTANGNVIPARQITLLDGSSVLRNRFLHLDTGNDVMYVGDGATVVNVVHAISNVTPPFPGPLVTVQRSRSIQASIGSQLMWGIGVDSTRNLLYVAAIGSGTSIHVFENASTLNGSHAPDRTFTVAGTSSLSSFLDAGNNRLYIADSTGNVRVYDSASTLSGPVPFSRNIILPVVTQFKIFVDPVSDRLYAVAQNVGFIVNGVSAASGLAPATVITLPGADVLLGSVVARP